MSKEIPSEKAFESMLRYIDEFEGGCICREKWIMEDVDASCLNYGLNCGEKRCAVYSDGLYHHKIYLTDDDVAKYSTKEKLSEVVEDCSDYVLWDGTR